MDNRTWLILVTTQYVSTKSEITISRSGLANQNVAFNVFLENTRFDWSKIYHLYLFTASSAKQHYYQQKRQPRWICLKTQTRNTAIENARRT